MIKYTSPFAETVEMGDQVTTSPIPGDNETPIIPWAGWISGEG
jgi:hypothetical protein